MRIWCSFTAKTGSIFTVILGISLCLFDELNVFACIIKEKHLLKLCSLSVCHMPNTSWGNTARRGEWNLLFPEASVHKHTQTHTQTDYCFFFFLSSSILGVCGAALANQDSQVPKQIFPFWKTRRMLFVYPPASSITLSLVCLTFRTHDLIFCLVALQICKLMPQLSAEAACGGEFIKPPCLNPPRERVWAHITERRHPWQESVCVCVCACVCVCVCTCDATVKGTICSMWQ